MRFKATSGPMPPLPEIARALEVDAVVEGAVARSADRVRVTAQLIDARTDRHLWARSYERDAHDVLALQSELRAIAEEVQVHVTHEERARLGNPRRVDPGAYEEYLEGASTGIEGTKPPRAEPSSASSAPSLGDPPGRRRTRGSPTPT